MDKKNLKAENETYYRKKERKRKNRDNIKEKRNTPNFNFQSSNKHLLHADKNDIPYSPSELFNCQKGFNLTYLLTYLLTAHYAHWRVGQQRSFSTSVCFVGFK